MTKPKISVIGAGLMGHGIAQVFALAGYDVTIYDSFAPTLASAKERILTNLKDLGDDQCAIDRVTPPVAAPTRSPRLTSCCRTCARARG